MTEKVIVVVVKKRYRIILKIVLEGANLSQMGSVWDYSSLYQKMQAGYDV